MSKSDKSRKQVSRAEVVQGHDHIVLQTGGLEFNFLWFTRQVDFEIRNDGDFVEGAVWLLTKECELELDRYEGVSAGLYRKEIFETRTGLKCLVHIEKSSKKTPPIEKDYFEKIKKAVVDLNLSSDYIFRIYNYSGKE